MSEVVVVPAVEPAVPAVEAVVPAVEAPQGAPENYEAFTLPEGVTFQEDAVKSLQAAAKELNLDQAGAQRLADLRVSEVNAFNAAQAKMVADAQAAWVAEAKADPTLGGEHFDANLGAAKGALTTFGSPELTKFLEESGLANHPEVLKLGFNLSKYVGDDNKIIAGARPAASTTSFYDHPTSKAK